MPHSPGPWVVEGIDADGKIGVGAPPEIKGGSGPLVCVCSSAYADNAANARLIAAAPDLLAACESVLPILDLMPKPTLGQWNWPQMMADQLRAALKKARG